MSLTRNNVEYLNVTEAIEFVTGGSVFVFNQLRKRYPLESRTFPGKAHSKWYKREDLVRMKELMEQ